MGASARGQRVGRYELVQILGEGGMGTVWLAHPYDAPDQLYAVKTVSAQYASDPRVCTMFVKEASLAAAIDHPNVVRLYERAGFAPIGAPQPMREGSPHMQQEMRLLLTAAG